MLLKLVMRHHRPINYLHIAEKNSIAKEVALILSDGARRTTHTLSKYNPVFLFQREGNDHTFSSVRGHLFQYELPPECKSWQHYDNAKLLTREVPMVKKMGPGMEDLLKNLERLAVGKTELVLWLDCDREGQAIAFEVIEIIRSINPGISISRARFAAVTRADILRAYNSLVQPNQLQADAVNYRIEMDFRMGCAFTRYQTVTFSKGFQAKQHMVISYGPCQMPTLGFVVDRYLEIKYFKPEKYWLIKASIILNEKASVELKWERGNSRDQMQANIMFYRMFESAHRGNGEVTGRVLERNRNPKKRYRPYPLTTISFQKLATDKLRLSSAEAMKIAEKLYQQGFISYPRTQTNGFPPTMNLTNLIEKLRNCHDYESYTNTLLGGQYLKPKFGKQNDQAHTPIHPVKPADPNTLSRNEWRIYDLISRHFLACCSKDAIGIESQIVADIGGERFKASHLTITEKNYLEIYPFDKWTESDFPGQIPEVFQAQLQLAENQTKPPGYLTESELITLMEKNQIGTDATIHEHIETIQNRKYAFKNGNTFKPTNLGAAIIVTYKGLGLQLQDCHIRRIIEQRMDKIAEGQLERNTAALETLEEVTPIYQKLSMMQGTWLEQMKIAMEEHSDLRQIEIQEANQQRQPQGDNSNTNVNSNSNLNNNSFGNSRQIICYTCNEPGHTSTNCPNRNQPKQEVSRPKKQSKHKKQQKSHNSSFTSAEVVCYSCKEPGHYTSQCPNKNRTNQPTVNQQGPRIFTCFICGQEGHFAPQCPNKQNRAPSSIINNGGAQSGIKCYSCGQPGHFSSNCPQKGKAVNKEPVRVEREAKVCSSCGVEGRHPRGTSCPAVRKKKNRSESEPEYQ